MADPRTSQQLWKSISYNSSRMRIHFESSLIHRLTIQLTILCWWHACRVVHQAYAVPIQKYPNYTIKGKTVSGMVVVLLGLDVLSP